MTASYSLHFQMNTLLSRPSRSIAKWNMLSKCAFETIKRAISSANFLSSVRHCISHSIKRFQRLQHTTLYVLVYTFSDVAIISSITMCIRQCGNFKCNVVYCHYHTRVQKIRHSFEVNFRRIYDANLVNVAYWNMSRYRNHWHSFGLLLNAE